MLKLLRSIPIPPHAPSEFNHGDVHLASGRVFMAHPSADTVEVLDGEQGQHWRRSQVVRKPVVSWWHKT
jgi:hypothetical protein